MLSHPYVALSPTLYPLSSRPALPAGERRLILSSAAAANIQPLVSHSYTSTLLLPKTSFHLQAGPSIHEVPFRERTSEKLYQWQAWYITFFNA